MDSIPKAWACHGCGYEYEGYLEPCIHDGRNFCEYCDNSGQPEVAEKRDNAMAMVLFFGLLLAVFLLGVLVGKKVL